MGFEARRSSGARNPTDVRLKPQSLALFTLLNFVFPTEKCWGTFKTRLREVLALLPHADLVAVQKRDRFQVVVKSTLEAYARDADGRVVAEHCKKMMLSVLQGQVA